VNRQAPAVQLVGERAVLLQGLAVLDTYYLLAMGLRAVRSKGGTPAPRLDTLQALLRTAATAERDASQAGHDDVAPEVQGAGSPQADEVSTTEAADLLGIGRRQVQRLAHDLDGRKIGGVWLFDRRAIQCYQRVRTERTAA